MTLNKIAQLIGASIKGGSEIEIEINDVAPLWLAQEGQLSFLHEKAYLSKVKNSKASAIITFMELETDIPQLIVKNTRKAMTVILDDMFPEKSAQTGISKMTDIAADVVLGKDLCIESFVKIGSGSKIGNNVVIQSNVTIGEHCEVGDGTVLKSGVVITNSITVGKNTVINSGTVIGGEGFGYFFDEGVHQKIPHPKGVVIGDNVEIGSNAVVDSGCLFPTTIGDGTKIDNLVQIAHNVTIGKHCVIAAQSGSLGGATLEDYVAMGGKSDVGKIVVGKGAQIAGRAGVTKDVPPGTVVSGFPAQKHSEELRYQARLRKLATNKEMHT
jgi:UDP-3-O-[3-hydroxymyristoyl] glucosamine N-acyltransferase